MPATIPGHDPTRRLAAHRLRRARRVRGDLPRRRARHLPRRRGHRPHPRGAQVRDPRRRAGAVVRAARTCRSGSTSRSSIPAWGRPAGRSRSGSRRGDVLIGPDNGLLVPAAGRLGGIDEARELANADYRLPVVTSTFHGRDIFAPAAAHLARRRRVRDARARRSTRRSLVPSPLPAARVADGGLETEVVYEDTFGNAKLSALVGGRSRRVRRARRAPVRVDARRRARARAAVGAHVRRASARASRCCTRTRTGGRASRVNQGSAVGGAGPARRAPAGDTPALIRLAHPATLPPGTVLEEIDHPCAPSGASPPSLLVAAIAAACSGRRRVAVCGGRHRARRERRRERRSVRRGPVRGAVARRPTPARPRPWPLKTAGTLTIGADNPAYPPYFEPSDTNPDPWELGDPTNGKGFESAVALRDRRRDGLREGRRRPGSPAPFNNAIQPGPKDFDIYLTQVSLQRRARRRRSTCRDGYYDVDPVRRRAQGQQARQGDDDRRPQGLPVRRPGRHDQPRDDHRRRSPRPRSRRSTTRTTSRSRRSRTARSTGSSSTCRRRST